MTRRTRYVLAVTAITMIAMRWKLTFDGERLSVPAELVLFSLQSDFKSDQLSENVELLYGYRVLGKKKSRIQKS